MRRSNAGSSVRKLRRARETNWLPGGLVPLRLDPFFLAEQDERIRRRVALKVMKPSMDANQERDVALPATV